MNHGNAERSSLKRSLLIWISLLAICVLVAVVPVVVVKQKVDRGGSPIHGSVVVDTAASPTEVPSDAPSQVPTRQPTLRPTDSPTSNPSRLPSFSPTFTPSAKPTPTPSALPTTLPSRSPSGVPSRFPSARPTRPPTGSPTESPTTRAPTIAPVSWSPTSLPTTKPPTAAPSLSPSRTPSQRPYIYTPESLTLPPISKLPTDEQTSSPAWQPTSLSPTTAMPTPMPTASQLTTVVSNFVVVDSITHDTDAFTQGLTFDPQQSGFVYESTGLYGHSDVRKVDIATGQVLMVVDTPTDIFGEGLAYYTSGSAGRLIHITWKSRRGFIFDAATLDVLQEFSFSTRTNEGWGITYDPNTDQFLVTDGSSTLHFWDRNLNEVKRVAVTMQRSLSSPPQPVVNLNEIEWDEETQTVLANVWQTDDIVRIDPTTGKVITLYDLSLLFPNRPGSADVLNGIAISPARDLWVTGKLWPTMYKIEFIE